MPSELNNYATYQLPWRDSMGSCVRFDKKLYLACFITEYEILFPRWNEFI